MTRESSGAQKSFQVSDRERSIVVLRATSEDLELAHCALGRWNDELRTRLANDQNTDIELWFHPRWDLGDLTIVRTLADNERDYRAQQAATSQT